MVHALLSYQNYASANNQDTAYYVEDRGTDTTGGRKLVTLLVDNNQSSGFQLIRAFLNLSCSFSLSICNVTLCIFPYSCSIGVGNRLDLLSSYRYISCKLVIASRSSNLSYGIIAALNTFKDQIPFASLFSSAPDMAPSVSARATL